MTRPRIHESGLTAIP